MRDAADFFANEFFDAWDKLVDHHKDLHFPELSLKFDTKPAATLQLHSLCNVSGEFGLPFESVYEFGMSCDQCCTFLRILGATWHDWMRLPSPDEVIGVVVLAL